MVKPLDNDEFLGIRAPETDMAHTTVALTVISIEFGNIWNNA